MRTIFGGAPLPVFQCEPSVTLITCEVRNCHRILHSGCSGKFLVGGKQHCRVKVYPVPKVEEVPISDSNGVAGSYLNVFVASVPTRVQAHKKVKKVNLADSILGSVFSKEVSTSGGTYVRLVVEPERETKGDKVSN